MVTLNKAQKIFTLAIILIPLFSFSAEEMVKELASKKEKISPKWLMHVTQFMKSGSELFKKKEVYLEGTHIFKNSLIIGVPYDSGDSEMGRKLSDLIIEKLQTYNDEGQETTTVDFKQAVRSYFKNIEETDPAIFRGDAPRVSHLFAAKRDEDNLYVISVGGRVMIIRNDEIIFCTDSNRREFSNPEIFTHRIKAGDIVLTLTKPFEQLSDEHIIKILSENAFKLGSLLTHIKGPDTKEAVLVSFFNKAKK